jgi:hypothetical protein
MARFTSDAERTKLSGLELVLFKSVETFTRTTDVLPSPLE